ncbi:MAG: hypothetical protein ABW321_26515 [Polyangiales bacterium]
MTLSIEHKRLARMMMAGLGLATLVAGLGTAHAADIEESEDVAAEEDANDTDEAGDKKTQAAIFVGCFATYESCVQTIPWCEDQWPNYVYECTGGGLAQVYCNPQEFGAAMFADPE